MNTRTRLPPAVTLPLLPPASPPQASPAKCRFDRAREAPVMRRPLQPVRPMNIVVPSLDGVPKITSADAGASAPATPLKPRVSSPAMLALLPSPVAWTNGNSPGANADSPGRSKARADIRDSAPATPGPFMLIKHLETGVAADTVAAWDLGSPMGGRALCLKVFQKKCIVDRKALSTVSRERIAYKRLALRREERGAAFLMQLHASLQDETCLYYVMELMQYDLLAVLTSQNHERRLHARRWLAQAALGLSAIHDAGIIHRDIKPENLLIDARNNVRITDFGSCYVDPARQPLHPLGVYSAEVIGTWEYMAPEMLRNKTRVASERRQYGLAVDYWGLGCVAFELEAEECNVLFASTEELDRYLNWDMAGNEDPSYLMFAGLSDHAESLISGLLRVSPTTRYGIEDLQRHPYFIEENRCSEFENAEARALRRPERRIELPDVFLTPERAAPIVLTPTAAPMSSSAGAQSFENHGWINPDGIWGRHRTQDKSIFV